MEAPNLAMIPSGYKGRVVYSIMPENGVGDFTFVRSGDATRINKDGLIETVDNHVPRLNYDLVNGVPSECPSLLLEPQSTNLLTYSEDFSQTDWVKSGSSININQIVSPNGSLSADELVEGSGNGTHNVYDGAGTIGNVETLSVFAKKNTRSFIALQGGNSSCYYGLENGTVSTETNSTGKIEDFGNGWFRCSMTFTRASNTNNYIYVAISQSQAFYQGDGSSSVYIWGAMLEQSSYSTSYIPTSGLSVTRNAETCTDAGNASTFNSEQGILYAELQGLINGGTNRYISLSDNTSSNRLQIIFSGTANRLTISGTGNVGGSFTNIDYNSFVQSNINKIAIKFSASGVKLFVNGQLQGSNTDNVSWSNNSLTSLDFALWNQTSSPFLGKVKDIRYYDTEGMTDTEIDNLLTQLTQ